MPARERQKELWMIYHIINPKELGEPRGWNNGLLGPTGGRMLFVAGQIGTDDGDGEETHGFLSQFEVALGHVVSVVMEAGGAVENIGSLTIYVTDIEAYRSAGKALGEAYRRVMGRHYPTMALLGVTHLVEPKAKVEISAIAVL